MGGLGLDKGSWTAFLVSTGVAARCLFFMRILRLFLPHIKRYGQVHHNNVSIRIVDYLVVILGAHRTRRCDQDNSRPWHEHVKCESGVRALSQWCHRGEADECVGDGAQKGVADRLEENDQIRL
uniref:Secreted protein n=1 Tax=Steinernema glaseri TaxID=37863 RepID=A0A1I8ARX0_9BILA